MRDLSLEGIDARRAEDAIEIADRVWWVGHYLKGDPFQCHVYLIENGDQSVLFDPGSALTFRHTLRKIGQVIPFSDIKYFVCHHQDPDITGALPLIDQLIARDDAVLVTHWRAEALLKHYGLDLPFWRVEDNGWRLDLGEGRVLRFAFTPYAHFPGAFVSFDEATGTLFSSDLFGGFTEGFSLVARDEGYFEMLRPFHEHYIPSRDILQHALNVIEDFPLKRIAPQHGSIIPEPLISFIIDKLRHLDCGLFLLSQDDTDIQRLMTLNRALRDITQTMIMYRDFQDIAQSLVDIAQRLLPAEKLEFYARTGEGDILFLTPDNRYRGKLVSETPAELAGILGADVKTWGERAAERSVMVPAGDRPSGKDALIIPLFAPDAGRAEAVAVITLSAPVAHSSQTEEVIDQMAVPLQVAVERETIYRTLDLERQRFYETSIRDPLTGLFTRFYMQETMRRLMDIHDRDPNAAIGVVLADIDHFKSVNDTYGHTCGDEVLRQVAGCLMQDMRPGDLPVRLGGEEFAVFVLGESAWQAAAMAERLRARVAALTFDGPMAERRITASFGTARRRQKETLTDLIERADTALYAAKDGGRDRVCEAEVIGGGAAGAPAA